MIWFFSYFLVGFIISIVTQRIDGFLGYDEIIAVFLFWPIAIIVFLLIGIAWVIDEIADRI